jgi:diguanylate cyclase (GGDEF)-like protein
VDVGGRRLDLEELMRLEVMRGVAAESVAGCLAASRVVELAAGQPLLRNGQSNQTMYLLLAGRLTVHLGGLDSDPVAELGAGVSVGELSVIDHRPASADVVAATPSRLLAVDEGAFWRLVRASHHFAANLLVLMAQRMRDTNTTAHRLDRASTVDGLTGLRNRRWLEEHLARIVEREQRDGRPVSLAMIDIDHFKQFNDAHGHAAGDAALVAVAETIVRQVRPLDFAARYGGEELVLIFPATPAGGAVIATERVRRAVATLALPLPAGGEAAVTFSAGVAQVAPGESAQDAVERADQALYRAKQAGRNRVEAAATPG